MPRNRVIRWIVTGGLIAGACDITYAVVFSGFRGVPPMRLLQSVASGLLGASAFDGGWPTAVLGLGLHFLIALTFAVAFYGASRAFPGLVRHAVACGIGYGFFIYWLMNLAVLPLSAFPRKVTFVPIVVATGLIVHMFLIGLPIALAIRRGSTPPAPCDGESRPAQ